MINNATFAKTVTTLISDLNNSQKNGILVTSFMLGGIGTSLGIDLLIEKTCLRPDRIYTLISSLAATTIASIYLVPRVHLIVFSASPFSYLTMLISALVIYKLIQSEKIRTNYQGELLVASGLVIGITAGTIAGRVGNPALIITAAGSSILGTILADLTG